MLIGLHYNRWWSLYSFNLCFTWVKEVYLCCWGCC